MIHKLFQKLPIPFAQIPEPSQSDIQKEPTYRRASVDFVYKNGGDLAKYFLKEVEKLGIITDFTRMMCQRSPIVKNKFPSPPNWHVDRMPGTRFNLKEHLTNLIPGVIACICSPDKIETTEFICDGELILEEPDITEAVHKSGQYLQNNEGLMNWTTEQIENQLKKGSVKKASIEPNTIYKYDSSYFHKPPGFSHDGGYRIILRLNTPPKNFPHKIATNDFIIPGDAFYFTVSEDEKIWHKHTFNA